MDLALRQRMAAESLLENESLREGLDESAEAALLKWALACAEQITAATAEIEDEEEAQEAAYPRMRALRQMLEDVKSLDRPDLDPVEGQAVLDEILELAAKVYGPEACLPESLVWEVFTAALTEEAGQRIEALRSLLENQIDPEGE